ncbi:MAG: hypothetical protein J6W42_10030 [Bacteroidaceae bacterium]|nr:hypothetical protein [Bacteroidaceae bacterium]
MKHLLTSAFILLTSVTIQAHSWRINNQIQLNADFIDINAAMNSENVMEGDTLYLDPGTGLTGSQSVTKQVTIIGCGYFRADAPHDIASILESFSIKAPYTKVVGVSLIGEVNIDASNVTLERCKANSVIKVNAQHVNIRQCYGIEVTGKGATNLSSAYCTIENCILIKTTAYGVVSGLYFATIKNCYLKQTYNDSNLIYSCVFRSCQNCTVINSIYLNEPRPSQIWHSSTTELNQNNISSADEGNTEASIFTLNGADDRRFQLKEDSPAKGAATDGGDCGPFGGQYPYVIGGLPAGHPYYTKAVISPRSENDKVRVSLQIKMQNE